METVGTPLHLSHTHTLTGTTTPYLNINNLLRFTIMSRLRVICGAQKTVDLLSQNGIL